MPGEPSPEALALLDVAACGLMQTSDDGTFLRANRAFCAWLGYRADELVGRLRFQELLTMGGRIFHQTHWAPLLRIQGSISEVKLELVHRDGSRLPMVLNAIRRDHDGTMVHELAAYVARDRDRYEQELVRARIRLEQMVAEATRLRDEAKDRALFAEQMMGIVSHDLRNPLSTISMGSVLLARGALSPAQQRTVGQIGRAADRANRLITDLLDFTQARVGHGLAVELGPVDVHAVVADSLEELRLAHPGRTILHTRSGAGTCVADGDRLAQLLGNLVSNAATYGDPRLPITATSSVTPCACSIEVHNAGPPIAPELHASLFQPMTRGNRAGTQARSVGLGLFIVREIAKAHRGTAAVTSTSDDGTTFRIDFPRAEP